MLSILQLLRTRITSAFYNTSMACPDSGRRGCGAAQAYLNKDNEQVGLDSHYLYLS
jgi:hypothetical protein